MKKLSIVTAIALMMAGAASGDWIAKWDDDFTEDPPTFLDHWNEVTAGTGGASVDTNSEELIIEVGNENNAQRTEITTNTDQTGTETEFGGASLYNFFNHDVRVTLGGVSLDGLPDATSGTTNRNQYWFSIGDNVGLPGGAPRESMVGFLIEHIDIGGDGDPLWRLLVEDRDSDGNDGPNTGVATNLSGAPTGMQFTLSGTNATMSIEGATFDATGTGEMSFDIADFSDFTGDYNLNLGTRNSQDVDEKTVMKMDSFKVEVIPEPGTLAMLGLGTIGIMLFRRRLRKTA